jgi:cell division protein FtsI/penicillin-binding protein 2
VAAGVAGGRTVEPLLVVDPTTGAPLAPDEATAPAAAAPPAGPLAPEVVAQLRELMREVVVSGTATVLAPVPGEVHAKTGTAEYGTDTPPRTHAWMIGYRGDLAFAVLVEDGGFGAEAAGPIAARFLTAVP